MTAAATTMAASYWKSMPIRSQAGGGYSIEWASFRPTLVYGVGDYRHTAPLLRKCGQPKGTFWVPHDGKSKINPVHVEDVVEAVDRFDLDFVQLHGDERGEEWGRLPVRLIETRIAGPSGLPERRFPGAAWADLLDAGAGCGGDGLRPREGGERVRRLSERSPAAATPRAGGQSANAKTSSANPVTIARLRAIRIGWAA